MITVSSVSEKVHNFVKTHVTPEMKAAAKTAQENFCDTIQMAKFAGMIYDLSLFNLPRVTLCY